MTMKNAPRPLPKEELDEEPLLDGPPVVRSAPVPRVRVAPPPAEKAPRTDWAEKLVRILDDGIRIPGTSFGIGLDPILGFFLPGAGDVVTGVGGVALLLTALRKGVPTIVIARMLVNIAIDTIFGSIPIVGDVFDLFYRANRRNLELIEKFEDDPDAEPTTADYVLVGLAVLLLLLNIAIPILIIYGFGTLFD
jgi:hypothetical protein